MTTPTWTEARTPRSAADFRDDILAGVGDFLTSQAEGSPDRDVVEGEARALEAEADIRVALAATASTTTLAEAGDSWVDAKMSIFDLDSNIEVTPATDPPTFIKGRFQATKGVWVITLITTNGPLTINSSNASGIQVQTDDGRIFLCSQQSDVQLVSGNLYQNDVEFTARIAGTAGGNGTAGFIKRVVLGPAGLDVLPLIEGGDQDQLVVARDAETNTEYILRGLGRWATLGVGWTREAFDYLVPTYGNSDTTSVTRWTVDDSNPNGPGTVEVAVADAAGPATALTVATLQTALNGLKVKPVGSGALTVVAATADPLTITATLQTDGSVVDTVTLASANAAITALGNAFPLGLATVALDLVIDTLMGRNVVGASIPVPGSANGYQNLPDVAALRGFPGVQFITSLSMVADHTVPLKNVLQLTPALTVLT